MKAQKSGAMIFTSSTAGIYGYPNRAPYAAAKWGVIGVMKTLAMELGPYNIRANAIAPGAVEGPRMEGVLDREAAAKNMTRDAVYAGYASGTSMRTFVTAEDIAAMTTLAGQVLEDPGTETETLTEGDGPHLLAWRDWTDPAEVVTQAEGFDTHGVLEALESARGSHVPLGGGASMYVEPTRALVAVDVNTGNDTSMSAGTKANFALAKALPRALRVCGLGGQIVLDLAPMPKKDRRGFESALKAALRADSIETVLVGWTPLGHVELQRKRARVPLAELLG